jgi:hypothetical protein
LVIPSKGNMDQLYTTHDIAAASGGPLHGEQWIDWAAVGFPKAATGAWRRRSWTFLIAHQMPVPDEARPRRSS